MPSGKVAAMDSAAAKAEALIKQIEIVLFGLVVFGAMIYWACSMYWFLREGTTALGEGIQVLDWIGWTSEKPDDWVGVWMIALLLTALLGPAGLLVLPILFLHLLRGGLTEV